MSLVYSYIFNSLVEGLPIRIINFYGDPKFRAEIKKSDASLYRIIDEYVKTRDLVELYKEVSKIKFPIESLPPCYQESNSTRLFSEMAKLFSLKPEHLNRFNETQLDYSQITNMLNPMLARETYVLKYEIHCCMYENILKRNAISSILEIGVFLGGSTHAWRLRLPKCKLYSMDINHPHQDRFNLERCKSKFTIGSAINMKDLLKVTSDAPFDMIIDDASHLLSHQIGTFLALSIMHSWSICYVIEDLDLKEGEQQSFMNFVRLLRRFKEDKDVNAFMDSVYKFRTEETNEIFDFAVINRGELMNLAECNVSFFGDNICFEH
ncbi:class I SAM-dependent methyltransferase [Synechococcus sp. N26]|uniref:class I SAM-dependent methyltransferase n=1 Tax=Synechococcus sp. N26 TaxID=2575513 RepID=UPI0010BDD275|nr:class I SAM-dependent methyltransferase [Synechococcus sp. N26]